MNSNKNKTKKKIIIIVLFSIFFYWLISFLLPIFIAEIRYRLLKTFKNKDFSELIENIFTFPLKNSSKLFSNGMEIPSIFLKEAVVFNVDFNDPKKYNKVLKTAIAHAKGTALPNELGTGLYFAHSSNLNLLNNKATIFYNLNKVKVGDSIYIYFKSKKYSYKVFDKKVVWPNQVKDIKYTNKKVIILSTCYPIGSDVKRLIVLAEATNND